MYQKWTYLSKEDVLGSLCHRINCCPTDEDFPRVNSGRELAVPVAIFTAIEPAFLIIPLFVLFVVVKRFLWKNHRQLLQTQVMTSSPTLGHLLNFERRRGYILIF